MHKEVEGKHYVLYLLLASTKEVARAWRGHIISDARSITGLYTVGATWSEDLLYEHKPHYFREHLADAKGLLLYEFIEYIRTQEQTKKIVSASKSKIRFRDKNTMILCAYISALGASALVLYHGITHSGDVTVVFLGAVFLQLSAISSWLGALYYQRKEKGESQ